MEKLFGKASDFFEVKLFKIEEVIPKEFEWDELTAYLGPRTSPDPEIKFFYQVCIRDVESKITVKEFEFQEFESAKLKFEEIYDDLMESEVSEFIKKHGILMEDS